MAVPNLCVNKGRDLINCLEKGCYRWDHPFWLLSEVCIFHQRDGDARCESEADCNRWCVYVFVSGNNTSLFTVHWTLHARPVRPDQEELFPCLKPKITSWPAGNRGQFKATALGSCRTLRTLRNLIRRNPVCTLKEVCKSCVSLIRAWFIYEKWKIILTVGYVMSS